VGASCFQRHDSDALYQALIAARERDLTWASRDAAGADWIYASIAVTGITAHNAPTDGIAARQGTAAVTPFL
jgi:hypothetical protein